MHRIALVTAVLAATACVVEEEPFDDLELASYAAPHFVKNQYTWSCLDVPGGASANFTPINQYWPCHGGPNQQLTVLNARDRYGNSGIALYHAPTRKCVTIDGSPAPGDSIFLYECSSFSDVATNQLFQLRDKGTTWRGERLYEIRAPWYPNKCMDVPGGTLDNGVQMQMYPCHGGPNQAWNVSYTYADPS